MRLTKLSIFSFLAALLLLWGCSTTNHGTLPTMAYHDITSHYNAYFNSNEKLTSTIRTAEAQHRDKFDSVIPVYAHSDSKEFASYSGDLDDVIKRSTMGIQLHNVSNWSDDHMLLIGKASYLKGDYDKAAGSFKYITTEYKEGVDYVKVMRALGKRPGKYVKVKKKPKKPEFKEVTQADGSKKLEKVDNRPSFSVWIHTPARSEALIWLIKTYTRTGRFDEAASVITYVRSDDNFYKNYDPQLELADADLQVTRKNYNAAIEPLEKYLAHKKIRKRKKLKTRALFVLAQCYEMKGDYPKATLNYKEVLKSRPNYDMEFYAKLKMAKLGRGGSDNSSVKALLAKMAKDGKYKDYYDQIYYELAMISLQENQRDEARKFLHKSVDNSTTNDDQRALSYLKLAELDYQDEAYVTSKFFYDSTLNFMAKNDARYPDIEERDKLLDNLVKQLNIIAEEDSVQKIAAMPEAQRQKYIRDAIARKEQEEEAKKEAEETAKQQQQLENFKGSGQQNGPQQPGGAPAGSNWYFYNTAARATGYNDFIKKWGRRKLEENWRRKNKSSNSDETDTNTAAVDSAKTDDKKDVATGTPEEQMLAGIPTTPEKLDKSNERMIDAYYTAGTIYKDGLDAYDKAQVMFETLNSRFAKHKLLLESYYYLYLIAQKRGMNAMAQEYKGKILAEFPESVIAKVLRDPNFVNESKQKEQEVNNYYESTYSDFVNNRLDSAWLKAKLSDSRFKPNPLSAKFELLLALILAKQNRLEDYVQALNKLVNKNTDMEVKKTASNLLTALNKSSLPQIDLSKDSLRRDSLNALYRYEATGSGKPDSATLQLQQQLEQAKDKAKQQGVQVKVDTTAKTVEQPAAKNDTVNKAGNNVTPGNNAPANNVVAEDTSSPFKRSDDAVHYFIVYIKDPTVSANATTSVLAKLNAFNSTQYEVKHLQAKQVMIDSKNKLINVRQFKNRADVMEYYNVVRKQEQLYDDMMAGQYVITCISTLNFSTLLDTKNIDEYQKFFNRVYGK